MSEGQNRKQQRIAQKAMAAFGYKYTHALRLVREGKIKLDVDGSVIEVK